MIQTKNFDPAAENTSWQSESAAPPSAAELEFLNTDLGKWIPGFPGIFQNKTILDLGAGRGMLGIIVAERYSPRLCVSLDLGLHRLQAANSWTQKLNNFGVICGDAFNLPFPDRCFEIVVANSLLHHFPNLDGATTEIARVLQPGGYYIGREPNFDNPIVRTHIFKFDGTWLRRYARVTPNEYPLRAKEIRESFARAGCSCELQYFWRRFKYLTHPFFSIAISVRVTKVAQ